MTSFSQTIVYVRDMRRSVEFYRDALGLPVRFQSPDRTEFATGSCTLALHKSAEQAVIAARADGMPSGYCHIEFTVHALDEFHERMVDRGVTCLREPRAEPGGGRAAVYTDPDGLPVAVAQSTVDAVMQGASGGA